LTRGLLGVFIKAVHLDAYIVGASIARPIDVKAAARWRKVPNGLGHGAAVTKTAPVFSVPITHP